jgi:hypothetical protein
MKTRQITQLVAYVTAGTLWIFIVQNFLLLNVFAELLTGEGMDLIDYLDNASNPSFQALWISCFAMTMIWLSSTSKKRPTNSAEVREMRPVWWISATALVVLGFAYQLFFTVLRWQFSGIAPVEGLGTNYFPVPSVGWIVLILLVIFNVALLFWLPTMLASPKNYKFVVPGALKFLGGR